MITKRRLALLSSLTAAPVFAAPFLAIGENAELFLTGSAETRYEDNISLSASDEKDDVIWSVTPGAELLFGKNSLLRGSFRVQEQFNNYVKHDEFNSSLSSATFNAGYEGAKLNLTTTASYTQQKQNTRDATSANTLVRSDVSSIGANAEYAVTEKTKIGLGANVSETNYKSAAYSDQSNYTIPANYYFAIAPKLDLSAGFQYRKTEVNGPDPEDYYYNVGARGDFTAKLSGSFNVGYNVRKSDSSTTDDESGLGLKAGLNYAYSPKTSFSLDLSRDFQTGADSSSIETTSIGLGATTSLTPAISASASVSYANYDYISSSRNDDYVVANLGLTYTYNAHVSFQAGYTYNRNMSEEDSAATTSSDFVANVFRLSANVRY